MSDHYAVQLKHIRAVYQLYFSKNGKKKKRNTLGTEQMFPALAVSFLASLSSHADLVILLQ